MTPQLWVIAGPNGAGKSTLANQHIAGRIPVVNPDEIARLLAPENVNDFGVRRTSGVMAVDARRAHVEARRTFAFETTLTGKGELALMRRAREEGFKVNLVYVGIDSAALSGLRVASRVRAGGHDVSKVDRDRRFPRSLANLPEAMKIAHRSILLDNTGKRRRLVLSVEHGRTRFANSQPPRWAADAIAQVQGRGLAR